MFNQEPISSRRNIGEALADANGDKAKHFGRKKLYRRLILIVLSVFSIGLLAALDTPIVERLAYATECFKSCEVKTTDSSRFHSAGTTLWLWTGGKDTEPLYMIAEPSQELLAEKRTICLENRLWRVGYLTGTGNGKTHRVIYSLEAADGSLSLTDEIFNGNVRTDMLPLYLILGAFAVYQLLMLGLSVWTGGHSKRHR